MAEEDEEGLRTLVEHVDYAVLGNNSTNPCTHHRNMSHLRTLPGASEETHVRHGGDLSLKSSM